MLLPIKKHLITKAVFVLMLFFSAFTVIGQDFPDRSDMANRKKVAPGHCLITAKVKRIPARKSTSNKECEKLPCVVKVKIIKVNAYGSAFPVRFHKKQKLWVNFVYSASAFDNGRVKLPGLKRRDVFEASVKALQKMNSDKTEFYIYSYTKKP